jgi:hypothetical protein
MARVGRQAIRERCEEFVPNNRYRNATTEIREIVGFGDLAYGWAEFAHHRTCSIGARCCALAARDLPHLGYAAQGNGRGVCDRPLFLAQ